MAGWEATLTSAAVRLNPVPTSAREARHFVTDTLSSWRRDDLSEMACLLVSELVTNSILHARSPIALELNLSAERLHIEVCDDSTAMPARLEVEETTLTGRGLTLVEVCAETWGVLPRDGGKAVWFDLIADADADAEVA